MEKVIFKSAVEIAEMIKSRAISCEAVATQFLDQIAEFNPELNALSDLRDREEVLEEARQKDRDIAEGKPLGALHGLPITVKDSFNVKGLISSNGNPRLKANVAESDAELIRRLKAVGAIVMGKSNLALFAMDWQSSNPWFGQSNNPYQPAHVVGGSSGGSAAALASGFTALELGTDSGGSIRVPAHFCGVCGLRTTESALCNRGNMETPGMAKAMRYLVANGPLARNVQDLMLVMEVLWDSQESFAENPPVPFKQYQLEPGQNLKLAFSTSLGGVALDEEYRVIFEDFLEHIDRRRIQLVEAQPEYDTDELAKLWGQLTGFDFGAALKGIPLKSVIAYLFIKLKYKDSRWARAMAKGTRLSPYGYTKTLLEKDRADDAFSRFFDAYDAWITPVSAAPAFKHQKAGKPLLINGKKLAYTEAFIPYNFTTSIPGHPIAVIPIGKTSRGLPVGIQIHGKKWSDHKLLEIAEILESHTSGFSVPDMFGKGKR